MSKLTGRTRAAPFVDSGQLVVCAAWRAVPVVPGLALVAEHPGVFVLHLLAVVARWTLVRAGVLLHARLVLSTLFIAVLFYRPRRAARLALARTSDHDDGCDSYCNKRQFTFRTDPASQTAADTNR